MIDPIYERYRVGTTECVICNGLFVDVIKHITDGCPRAWIDAAEERLAAHRVECRAVARERRRLRRVAWWRGFLRGLDVIGAVRRWWGKRAK